MNRTAPCGCQFALGRHHDHMPDTGCPEEERLWDALLDAGDNLAAPWEDYIAARDAAHDAWSEHVEAAYRAVIEEQSHAAA